MNILVIGGGGREHALAWRFSKSSEVDQVFVAPGNGGTASTQGMRNINLSSAEDLLQFAKDNHVALTVV
ncbi:phosphoribosylamine--glycine ligase family protein, partial [Micrococcus luteus]|nr:phosphoribosylamine--glycine ligase family protein [Micrococcus luteus]